MLSIVLPSTLTASSNASFNDNLASSLYSCFKIDCADCNGIIRVIQTKRAYLTIGTNTSRFPSSIVTTRVAFVQLEAVVSIPAHVKQ